MKRTSTLRWSFVLAIVLFVGAILLPTLTTGAVFAQGDPQATATATEPPATNTPTSTPSPTVVGPTATEFPATPTATPRPKETPKPVPIPEPVTVVLFGTGLAALSAAVATRRKKND